MVRLSAALGVACDAVARTRGFPARPSAPPGFRAVYPLTLAAVAFVLVAAGCGGAKQPIATTPPPKPFRIVFPEGFTRAQMAERVQAVAKIAFNERHVHPKISARTYLKASRPQHVAGFGAGKLPLEGFLFPALYDFLTNTTSKQLVAAQLQAFHVEWSKVDLSYARSKNLTPYDVLKIASIVEREAVVPSERKLVAAVIYNRLHVHMPLGMDSTIRYGLNVPGTKPLLQSDLDSNNPYNSRKFLGLPPTPIANPGLPSIEAAAHPAHVDYLYFVRKPDHRHHYFTSNYNDFVNHEHLYGY
ncbi:MAG TPA: endolytic transglycosylase MltG [Gaiellaceae bacterium]|nr:endolytic transglycosylase MltG [Gaiellaceae bacterium]